MSLDPNPKVDHQKGVTPEVQIARFRSAQDLFEDLRALCAEANLRWSDAVVEPLKSVHDINYELWKAIYTNSAKKAGHVHDDELHKKVFGFSNDPMGERIDAAFAPMTAVLRQHI